MNLRIQLAKAFAVAATIALATPGIAAASDNDTREISSYMLTEPGLAKFMQATQKLANVPGACAEQEDDGSNPQSIDQMVAKMNSVPGVRSAIQSAGMTTREYVVFMWAMLHNGMAAWAVSQPGGKLPPGTLQSNIDFVKKHEAEMSAMDKSDPCADESGEEEEPEEG
jgi:hypothetical protein